MFMINGKKAIFPLSNAMCIKVLHILVIFKMKNVATLILTPPLIIFFKNIDITKILKSTVNDCYWETRAHWLEPTLEY